MNARVDAASAASHGMLVRVESAQNLLARVRRAPLNGFGVVADPDGVRADLAAVLRDISAALASLHTDWPTTADYLEDAEP
jgi:hypothetical protein